MKQKLLFVLPVLAVIILVAGNEYSFAKQPEGDVEIQFRVKWDGKIIPGITKVSGLKRKTEVMVQRGGGDPNLLRRSPGVTNYKPITIQRPRSKDKEFERWANKVWNFGSGLGTEVSLRDFRKDISIELVSSDGIVMMAFKVYRCWPSEYDALTDLDTEDDSPAMEVLILEHEGWERDYAIP
ncbi:phage tail protein [candidate division KSB1 bacterium]|nr:phage tail protein [candidate division KSB1 bacterium]